MPKAISKVCKGHKKKSTPIGVLFLFGEIGTDRFEKQNSVVIHDIQAAGLSYILGCLKYAVCLFLRCLPLESIQGIDFFTSSGTISSEKDC